MKQNKVSVGNSISIILVLSGCILLFGGAVVSLNIAGALLMAVGLWGLIR